MRPQPTCALVADHGICNGWVVQQANLVVMPGMQCADSLCLSAGQAQSLDEGVEVELRGLVEFSEEASGEVTEARQRILGERDVVTHEVLLATNLVALLVVGRGHVLLLQVLVVGLAGHLNSAALFAWMRCLHLVRIGQVEQLF
jgi:hypothetical protein